MTTWTVPDPTTTPATSPRPELRLVRPTPASFTRRETDVLRLLADGYSTGEIAKTLCYSERTIKGIVHDVTNRFQLRNRSHAVAFALRAGII